MTVPDMVIFPYGLDALIMQTVKRIGKTMQEKILSTEYGDVHYWISEDYAAERLSLFFLHGLTASHKLFSKQIEYYKGKYNLLTWDAPAHGRSRPYKNFTYEKAAVAAKRILDDNNISQAVFIGQSMGGFITQSVIKRYPDVVKGFVSVDSTPFGEKYYSASDRWWLRQIEWMSGLYPDRALRKAIAGLCTTKDDSYNNMMDMLSEYSKKELCHLMGIGFAGFLEDNCDIEIKCPVLLILGEYDKTGKVEKYNKEWSEAIGVPVTRIVNAAHNSNDDNPEAVNRAIDGFLNTFIER